MPGLGPSTLQRFNHQFSINLSSDVAPGHALDEASNDVRRLAAQLNLPPGYSVKLTGQTKILDETTTNLMMAIGLASIFVYMVRAAQFESFVQPIVIMLVVPLSVPFAHAQSVERPRDPAAARDREEELDPANRSHDRPER